LELYYRYGEVLPDGSEAETVATKVSCDGDDAVVSGGYLVRTNEDGAVFPAIGAKPVQILGSYPSEDQTGWVVRVAFLDDLTEVMAFAVCGVNATYPPGL